MAADSTPRLTAWASQGAWDAEEDAGVRALLEGARGLRVVATHFPPERGIMPFSILERLRGVPGGYLETDLRRLRELLEEQRVDLVVAGHVHAGKDRWAWDLGRTSVRVVGRSGALHGATPCYGLLAVLRSGKFEWRTVNL